MRAHERALVEARAEALAAARDLEKEQESREAAEGRLAEALEARARLRARVEDLEQELGQRRESSGAGSSSPGRLESSGCVGGAEERRAAEEAGAESGAEREESRVHAEERDGRAIGSLAEVSDGRKSQASISFARGMGRGGGEEEGLCRVGESGLSPSRDPAEHSRPPAPSSPGPTFGEPILSVSREDIVKPYRMRVRELEAALRRAQGAGAPQSGAVLGGGRETEERLDGTEEMPETDEAVLSSKTGPELSRLRCAVYAAIHRLGAALAAAGMALPPGAAGGRDGSDPGVLGLLSAAAAEAIAARAGARAGEENGEPNEGGEGRRSKGTFAFRRPRLQEQLEVAFDEPAPAWSGPALATSPVRRAPRMASPPAVPAASESSLDWEESELELAPELSRGESERDLQRCLGLLLHRLDHGPPALLAPACRAAHAALLRTWTEASGQGPDALCEAGREKAEREEVGHPFRLGCDHSEDTQRASKRGLLSDLDRGLESLVQQVARLETRGRTRGILLQTGLPR